ncbi:right-handed parallel beta-helix repeat-containing protein [Streptomyces polygonati]|uniref:Right-handed parallel beta-helix repeat-containing protein n=1 Tax=Streptomyces polygonati TaxID=1617087 RepID=A0ABV8HQX8_9ACTN
MPVPPPPSSPPSPPHSPEAAGRSRLPGGPGAWLGGAALVVALITMGMVIAGVGGNSGDGRGDGGRSGGSPSRTTARESGTAAVTRTTSPVETADPAAGPTGDPAGDPTILTADPTIPAGTGGPLSTAPVSCPAATVTVTDAVTLKNALTRAKPGDSIRLADGTYAGRFTATVAGSAKAPVFLCGGPDAVIDGGGVKGGYAVHLDGASYWRLVGFTVRDAQKGVVADRVQGAVLQGLTVEQIGDEAIHLRDFSSDNVVRDNTVSTTGLRRDKFGEGVYIGSAKSNWCTNSGCKPDASNRNAVLDNHISGTTAEAVDIKEGTTGGKVVGNSFDGSKLTGDTNDSWVDVKGNDWLIQGNTGRHSPGDGFQTHQIVDGWGTGNVFKGNNSQVDGPGWAFHLTSDGNDVACDNKVYGAARGLANVPCTP